MSERTSSDYRVSYPTKNQVEACNRVELAKRRGISFTYTSIDSGGYDSSPKPQPIPHEGVTDLLDRMIAPRELTLKVRSYFLGLQSASSTIILSSGHKSC